MRVDVLLVGLCAVMPAVGIFNVYGPDLFENKEHVQNIIEWNFSVMVLVVFLASVPLWRETGFRVDFKTNTS